MGGAAAHKRVVIVGAGFAGLNAAKALGGRNDLDVTVVDRHNYHLFQPLLYQVALATLSPAEIAAPIRSILREFKNLRVLQGEVKGFDLGARKVHTDFGDVDYDYLILAGGARHSYFGNDDWEAHAPGLKTLAQATEIRRRILTAYELAERETNEDARRRYLTFVIVGGGPTGVELAGAIAEISRETLARDFRAIDPTKTRIVLIEAAKRLLLGFGEKGAAYAAKDLEDLGVEIRLNSAATAVDENGIELGGERIEAATVLWAAGVAPSPLGKALGAELDKGGRVVVDADMSVPGRREIFVTGDMAHFEHGLKAPLPGLAPVAVQQGQCAAKQILRDLDGKERKHFCYLDKGQMAVTGRGRAIAEVGGRTLSGYAAWLAWIFIHIYYLTGFKNRLFVMLDWAWGYATQRRGARLIVQKDWRFYGPDPD